MNTKPLCRLAVLVGATLILPFLGAGWASNKTGGPASADTIPVSDMAPVWQNAGATSPAAAAPAPPPPPSRLGPGITSVGGPVSTKPAYATYDMGWPRIFTAADSTKTLYQPQVMSWDGMVLAGARGGVHSRRGHD